MKKKCFKLITKKVIGIYYNAIISETVLFEHFCYNLGTKIDTSCCTVDQSWMMWFVVFW